MPRQAMRKRLNAARLLTLSRRCFERIEDGTPVRTYRLVDCLMSVVAMFGLKSPSLLQFDREVRLDGRVRGNLRRAVPSGSGAVRHADADASGPGSGECLAPGLPVAVPRTAARQDAEAVCGVWPPLSVVTGRRHGLFCIGCRALPILLRAVVYKFVCKNEKRTVTIDAWLARISHNQVENDVFHGMRGVRGMEGRVASSKRLRRAGMRVFSTPFCGRDGESLSIRARGGRHAPPPASCTRLHRAFTLVPGWPRSTGNPSSTGRRTRTPDGSAAWTPSRAPGSGTRHLRSVDGRLRRSMEDTGRFSSRHFIMQ